MAKMQIEFGVHTFEFESEEALVFNLASSQEPALQNSVRYRKLAEFTLAAAGHCAKEGLHKTAQEIAVLGQKLMETLPQMAEDEAPLSNVWLLNLKTSFYFLQAQSLAVQKEFAKAIPPHLNATHLLGEWVREEERYRLEFVGAWLVACEYAGAIQDWLGVEKFLLQADIALSNFKEGYHDEAMVGELKGRIALIYSDFYKETRDQKGELRALEMAGNAYMAVRFYSVAVQIFEELKNRCQQYGLEKERLDATKLYAQAKEALDGRK